MDEDVSTSLKKKQLIRKEVYWKRGTRWNGLLWITTFILVILLLFSLWQALQVKPKTSDVAYDAKRLPDGKLLIVWNDYARSRFEVRSTILTGNDRVEETQLLGDGWDPRILCNDNDTFVIWRVLDWTIKIARVDGEEIIEIGELTLAKHLGGSPTAFSMLLDSNGVINIAYRVNERVQWEQFNSNLTLLGLSTMNSVGYKPEPRLFDWPNGTVGLLIVSSGQNNNLNVTYKEYNQTSVDLSEHFLGFIHKLTSEVAVVGLEEGGIAIVIAEEGRESNNVWRSLHYLELNGNQTQVQKEILTESRRNSSKIVFEITNVAITRQNDIVLIMWIDKGKQNHWDIYVQEITHNREIEDPKAITESDDLTSYRLKIASANRPYEVVIGSSEGIMIYTENEELRALSYHFLQLPFILDCALLLFLVLGSAFPIISYCRFINDKDVKTIPLDPDSSFRVAKIISTWCWVFGGAIVVTFFSLFVASMNSKITGSTPILVYKPIFIILLIVHLLLSTLLYKQIIDEMTKSTLVTRIKKLLELGYFSYALTVIIILIAEHIGPIFDVYYPVVVWVLFFGAIFITTLGLTSLVVFLTNESRYYYLGLLFITPIYYLVISIINYCINPIKYKSSAIIILSVNPLFGNFIFSVSLATILYMIFSEIIIIEKEKGIGWLTKEIVENFTNRELNNFTFIHVFFIIFIIFIVNIGNFSIDNFIKPILFSWNIGILFSIFGILFIYIHFKFINFTKSLAPYIEKIQNEPVNWLRRVFSYSFINLFAAMVIMIGSPLIAILVILYSVWMNSRLARIIKLEYVTILKKHYARIY